jgi:AcrR family transcriptional regulator
MTGSTGRAAHDITPNRRGARSREAVLDAAERLIAQHGYKAATVAALVEEAGVAASSIYHHFDCKQGVVLATLERGAERRRRAACRRGPRRLGARPPSSAGRRGGGDARAPSRLPAHPGGHDRAARRGGRGRDPSRRRPRARARLRRLRREMHVALGLDPAGVGADHLARFSLAALTGPSSQPTRRTSGPRRSPGPRAAEVPGRARHREPPTQPPPQRTLTNRTRREGAATARQRRSSSVASGAGADPRVSP